MVDEEPPTGGLSQEKADELRKLLPVLESRIKDFQGNPNFADLAQEVRDLKAAIKEGNKLTAMEQVTKSIRNICEGVVGGVIVELIPENMKAWMKEHVAQSKPAAHSRKWGEDRLFIVKLELVDDGVDTIDIILNCEGRVILTFAPPFMRVWCGSNLATFLRLSLRHTWIEHPTSDELEEMRTARFEPLTPASAQELKKAVAALAHEIAKHHDPHHHRGPDRHPAEPRYRP